MTFTKAIGITFFILVLHAIGIVFGLYSVLHWYDIPLHFGGGLAMGALGLAIWQQGIHEVHFQKRLEKHLSPWLVPLFVLGFVSLISIGWEIHEYVFDQLFTGQIRQPGVGDTMYDFVFDLSGGLVSLILFYWYGKR
jgi:hypothetical protein